MQDLEACGRTKYRLKSELTQATSSYLRAGVVHGIGISQENFRGYVPVDSKCADDPLILVNPHGIVKRLRGVSLSIELSPSRAAYESN